MVCFEGYPSVWNKSAMKEALADAQRVRGGHKQEPGLSHEKMFFE